jgi:hypothetical protein
VAVVAEKVLKAEVNGKGGMPASPVEIALALPT